MNKVGSILMKLVALIMLAVAGIWIAALIMGQWYKLEVSGTFVKWKSLAGPQRFQKIVNVEDFDLRARAEDGSVYAYTTEWKAESGNVEHSGYHISADCESASSFFGVAARYPPPEAGTPVECGIFERRHPLVGTVDVAYYVLLDNANIWMWRHTRDPQQEIAIFLAGLLIGLIAGIIAWFPIQKWF